MIVKINYDQVEARCKEIVQKYKNFNTITVLGVATGGIVPAFMIAFELDKLTSVDYKTVRPEKPCTTQHNSEITLIIDDILDTGKTKESIMKNFTHLNNVYFETLYTAKKDEWLIFPWELPEDRPFTRQSKI